MNAFNFLLSLIIISSNIYGQSFLPSIPDSLKKDADAIIIENIEVLELIDKEKIKNSIASKILIYNDNLCPVKDIVILYDQFTKIEEIDVNIHDINGKKIKTIKKKDFQDIAYQDGFSIASDARYLIYRVTGIETPYILTKEIKSISNQSFFLNGFIPFEGKNVEVIN